MSHGNKNIKVAPKIREITFLGCPKKLNMVGGGGSVPIPFDLKVGD
jgi:hypothetical protein